MRYKGVMQTNISYADALQNHPEQVQQIIQKLRNSSSKEKNTPPENLKWFYTSYVQIFPLTLDQVFQNTQHPPTPPSVEQQMADFNKNCHVVLSASKGHWYASSDKLPTIPNEILEPQHNHYKEMEQDRIRFENLSPEKKEEEVKETLRQLGFDPSSIAIMVKKT